MHETTMHGRDGPPDPLAAPSHPYPYPYPYYAALARQSGLVHDARLGMWIAAEPALVRAVLADPACRVRPVHEPVPAGLAGPAGSVFGALVRMNDGPGHAAHKAVLAQALAGLDAEPAQHCAARVAAMLLADGPRDAAMLNRFVYALPVCTVASLLGFDDAQLPALAAWTGQFVACLSPRANAQQVAAAHAAATELLAALRRLSIAGPRTPLLATITAGDWANPHALEANLLGLLSQSFEATAGLLGNCIVGLLRGAPQEGLVARTMHGDPAIHNTRRFTASEVRLGGVTVPAGQTILVVLAAPGAQDGFGHGRHACPGQALARTIAASGLEALLACGALPPLSWRYRPSANARLPEFLENPT